MLAADHTGHHGRPELGLVSCAPRTPATLRLMEGESRWRCVRPLGWVAGPRPHSGLWPAQLLATFHSPTAAAADVPRGARTTLWGWQQSVEIAGIQRACVLPAAPLGVLTSGVGGGGPQNSLSGPDGAGGHEPAAGELSCTVAVTETRGPHTGTSIPKPGRGLMWWIEGQFHCAHVFLDKPPSVLAIIQTVSPNTQPLLLLISIGLHDALLSFRPIL